MRLTAKNLLINIIYYSVTVVTLPALILWIESFINIQRHPNSMLKIMGAMLVVAGAVLQAKCLYLFQRIGLGTPSPLEPTKHLVHSGPYRRVRNPMNIGEVTVFIGLAAWFGSLGLTAYAAAAWIAFHLFIVNCEEPRNRRDFGQAYVQYVARVGRWLPW